MGYKKLTKKEIKIILKDISPMIYISDKLEIEKFKQLYYFNSPNDFNSGMYYPHIISNFGRVFVIRENKAVPLVIRTDRYGYKVTHVYYNKQNKHITIHRAVAISFVKNNNYILKNQVNHIDGDKTNNYYWNLEWCTTQYNTKHAILNGLRNQYGEFNTNNIHKNENIEKVCELLEKNKSFKEISEKTGVSYYEVSLIYRKKIWVHISSNYNFSNYTYGNKIKYKTKRYIKKINRVCKLLSENELTIEQISDITSIPVYTIKNIYKGISYKDLFNKYKMNKMHK